MQWLDHSAGHSAAAVDNIQLLSVFVYMLAHWAELGAANTGLAVSGGSESAAVRQTAMV